MIRTITARAEPQGKRPGTVTFNDGTQAKFWARALFSPMLQQGSTGDCNLKVVPGKDGYPDETFVDSWTASGSTVAQNVSQGPITGDSRNTSIEVQVAAKCAAEVLANAATIPNSDQVLLMVEAFFNAIQECKEG